MPTVLASHDNAADRVAVQVFTVQERGLAAALFTKKERAADYILRCKARNEFLECSDFKSGIAEAKFAYKRGYTDATPFEIVRVVSANTLEVRELGVKLQDGQKPEFYVGGFAGHCHNQRELVWEAWAEPKNEVIRIRLQKDNTFKDKHGDTFRLTRTPYHFYDYNF